MIRYAAPSSGEPAPPAPPAPAAVRCGDVLTKSTLVTNDLSECLGDGLVIGAPRIIVDLGGHAIDGTGLGTGVRNEGYESVQVRNGTVRDFDRGVYLLPETRGNVLERLRLEHNEVGGDRALRRDRQRDPRQRARRQRRTAIAARQRHGADDSSPTT